MTKDTLLVYLPASLKIDAKIMAAKSGMSLSELVVKALEELMRKEKGT